MYWIPSVFLFTNLIFIYNLDKIIKYSNCLYLYEKYKDIDLSEYLYTKYKDYKSFYLFLLIAGFFELIYFIVGLFYSFWFFSIFILGCMVFISLYSKIKKNDIRKIVKSANLEDFESKNIKFQRILKINELDERIKTNNWVAYILPTIKIIIYILIIVLHYNYNLI